LIRLLNARGLAVALAAAGCVAAAVAQPPTPAPYVVVARTGRQPLPVRVIAGQEMFSLDDLARLFNVTVREDALAGGLTVRAGTQTIVMTPQQPLASVGGRMISLPAAPAHEGRTWFVPVDFVSRALALISPTRLELRKPSRLVLLGDIRFPRIAGRVEPLGAITRLTFEVAPPTPHQVSPSSSQLAIHFEADGLDAPFPAADARGAPAPGGTDLRAYANDVFKGVFLSDTPGTLVIDLGPRFASFRASEEPGERGATRLVVDLIAQTTQPQTGTAPPQPAPPEPPPLLDLPPVGGLRTIVLDPGHGGEDAGVRGLQGTLEKNVTLAVARRLKGALEARLGVRVILTRDGDQTIGLDERAAVANNNKADLFLSLHANASLRPGVAGAEVFYLGLADYGEQAQKIARGGSESLPVVGGGNRDIDVIVWELAQARHIDRSASLARIAEATLREHVPMSARALQQAPFRVLVGANMPAVLVEMGFLTNAQQERQLASDDFQNALTAALLDAVVRYRDGAAPHARALPPVVPPESAPR
jgi:N-acetylmuramoyl-L-alanine amidase